MYPRPPTCLAGSILRTCRAGATTSPGSHMASEQPPLFCSILQTILPLISLCITVCFISVSYLHLSRNTQVGIQRGLQLKMLQCMGSDVFIGEGVHCMLLLQIKTGESPFHIRAGQAPTAGCKCDRQCTAPWCCADRAAKVICLPGFLYCSTALLTTMCMCSP
jgi:hypothetical protein